MNTLKTHDYVIVFAILLLILALVVPFASKAAVANPVTVEHLPGMMIMQDAGNPDLEI